MKGFTLAGHICGINSLKDKSVKITFETQELSPEKAGLVFTLIDKVACIYISSTEISQKEIDQVDKINPEFSGKTPSQRLRNVFFKLFEQDKEGFNDFDSYYKNKMEKVIDHYKNLIV